MTAASVPAATARYFVALDSWRGVCALMVAAGHLKTSGILSQFALLGMSYRFVDFFFVLSGFVISHAARDRLCASRSNVWAFLIRRIGRLWPLHLATIAAVAAYELALLAASTAGIDAGRAAFTDKTQLAYLPANLLLVQAWNILPSASWNVPAWSISAEFAAYLLFALLFTLFKARGLIILAVIGLVCGFMIASPTGPKATFDLGVPRCLFGFATGALVHAAWRSRPDMRIPYATVLEIAAIIVTILLVAFLPFSLGILIVPALALVVWLFAYEGGQVSRLLSCRTGRFLGERSYSIYMVHFIIAVCLLSVAALAPMLGLPGISVGEINPGNGGIIGPAILMDALIIAYLGIVVVVAMFSYRWIEVPARNIANRLARKLERSTLPKPGPSVTA